MDDLVNMINMVNSNCKFSYNENASSIRSAERTSNSAFHEERDKDKYVPDGNTIAYVRSNFCELYHDRYSYLKDIKHNKKVIDVDKRKHHGGTGDEFASSITMGVIHGDKVYEIRIFRRNTIGISGLLTPNKSVIVEIVNSVLNYVNSIDPELNVKIVGEPVITLCNANYNISLPPAKTADSEAQFNIYLLNELINKKYTSKDYWNGGVYTSMYNGITSYFYARILHSNNTHLIKFYGNGKLNIYGGSDEAVVKFVAEQFVSIIKSNYNHLVQTESIPSRKQPLQ